MNFPKNITIRVGRAECVHEGESFAIQTTATRTNANGKTEWFKLRIEHIDIYSLLCLKKTLAKAVKDHRDSVVNSHDDFLGPML